jgi:hypothetical protein
VSDQYPYRMLMRRSIVDLAPGVAYELRFDQIGDVFPPGMVGAAIHPKALADMLAFAADVGCTVTKDNAQKAFVFCKQSGH